MLGRAMRAVLATSCDLRCMTKRDRDLGEQGAAFCLTAYGALYVVNCAGAIHQRGCDTGEMVNMNAAFPLQLSMAHMKVIHISTDCVFSGRAGPYSESDTPDPTSAYGMSKALGESPRAMVIRTSLVGHSRDRSYGLLDWVLAQEGEIEGWELALWNGVTCLQLARYVRGIIAQGAWRAGVVHYHSSEIVSKFQLLRLILAVYGKDQEAVKGIPGPDINRALIGTEAPVSLRTQLEDQRRFWEAG